MSAVLTTPIACKLAMQLLGATTGASLDVLSQDWFGTWHLRGGLPDAEFREALSEAVEGKCAELEGLAIRAEPKVIYFEGPSHVNEHRMVITSDGVKVERRDGADALGVERWIRVDTDDGLTFVSSWLDAVGPAMTRAGGVPRDYIVAREQLGRLLDAITPDDQVARCMDPVSTVAEVDAAIDVVVRLRGRIRHAVDMAPDETLRAEVEHALAATNPDPGSEPPTAWLTPEDQPHHPRCENGTVTLPDLTYPCPACANEPDEPPPTTDGLEGWGPRAVQGDGGVWEAGARYQWVKWPKGWKSGEDLPRAWAEDGRVAKTSGNVTPADVVALEEAWAGEQRTRLVGSTLKDSPSGE